MLWSNSLSSLSPPPFQGKESICYIELQKTAIKQPQYHSNCFWYGFFVWWGFYPACLALEERLSSIASWNCQSCFVFCPRKTEAWRAVTLALISYPCLVRVANPKHWKSWVRPQTNREIWLENHEIFLIASSLFGIPLSLWSVFSSNFYSTNPRAWNMLYWIMHMLVYFNESEVHFWLPGLWSSQGKYQNIYMMRVDQAV